MRLYWEIARRSFGRVAVYRWALIAGILTNAFFGAVRAFVFRAVYATGGSVAGWTQAEAVSYTWTTQAMISLGVGWLSYDIMRSIRTGDVITDLSRPWSFQGYWFSRAAGERLGGFLIRAPFTYGVGMLFFAAQLPGPGAALGFAVSVLLALIVSFAFGFLVNLTAFWMIDNTGVMIAANTILSFFSGFLLPIAFFPAPLQAVANALPFRAITAIPAEIWLGRIAGDELLGLLALQAFWAVVLTLLGAWLLRAAMYKIVIQGG